MTALIVWGGGTGESHRCGSGKPDRSGATRPHRRDTPRWRGRHPVRTGAPSALPDDGVLVLALPGHARQGDAVRQLAMRGLVALRCRVGEHHGVYGVPRGVVDENTPAGHRRAPKASPPVEADFRAWAGERGWSCGWAGCTVPAAARGRRWPSAAAPSPARPTGRCR
ncbi:MAG: hypothetical protein R2851_19410 [Caldilineaceae bacterium]